MGCGPSKQAAAEPMEEQEEATDPEPAITAAASPYDVKVAVNVEPSAAGQRLPEQPVAELENGTLATLEGLPHCVASHVQLLAGSRAVVSLERTSKATRAAVTNALWKQLADGLWSSPPFSTRTVSFHPRVPAPSRPAVGPSGHKGVYRASLADALTTEELTRRQWYHTRTTPWAVGMVLRELVRFHPTGTMSSCSWDGRHGGLIRGGAWQWVERGLMSISWPGSLVQYKITSASEEGDRDIVYPALTVYRVNCGWVLKSQAGDVFTSFPRRDVTVDGEPDCLHRQPVCACHRLPPMPTLRAGVPAEDRLKEGRDLDWVLEELDAFRHSRGLVFGTVIGNGFRADPDG